MPAKRPAASRRRTRRPQRPAAAPIGPLIERLDAAHPDAKLALDFASPLQLLVALILAAQCTDAKVNEVTPALFARFPTPRDLAAADPDELEALVRQTGFYRQKARAVRSCCQQLVERFNGEVPRNFDHLLSLPGVGRKTANILLGNAFAIPGIGVDTHVARLSQRLGLTQEQDPDKIEADLSRIVPTQHQIRFCHLLQFHGRRICSARNPACPQCTVAEICPFPDKTDPPKPKKTADRSRWVGRGA